MLHKIERAEARRWYLNKDFMQRKLGIWGKSGQVDVATRAKARSQNLYEQWLILVDVSCLRHHENLGHANSHSLWATKGTALSSRSKDEKVGMGQWLEWV